MYHRFQETQRASHLLGVRYEKTYPLCVFEIAWFLISVSLSMPVSFFSLSLECYFLFCDTPIVILNPALHGVLFKSPNESMGERICLA